MNSIDIENFLNRKGVKPTSNRILVTKELMKVSHPVSLADLEILLGFSMEKASIFRVLELFSEKEIVHVIEDGSRSFKYELCYSDTHHTISDQHVHFYCERCKKTKEVFVLRGTSNMKTELYGRLTYLWGLAPLWASILCR